ncbi:hypothetical protein KKH82_05090 [Patescibacteria group bacterium]|nr:hypothetical protein [Patescibacteria group bacterium]
MKGHQMMIYEALQDDQLQELIDSMRNHLGKNAPKRKDSVINTYLDNNYYAPCNNMDFLDSIKTRRQESMYHRKTQAFEGFIKHVIATYNTYYGKKFIEGRTL